MAKECFQSSKKYSENVLSPENLLKSAMKFYGKEFKRQDLLTAAAYAPGRAIFFGGHAGSNNKELVLLMALPLVTVVAGCKNNTKNCVVAIGDKKTVDKPHRVEFPVPSVQECKPGKPQWANYVKGIVQNFKGYVPGFNAVIVGNVPLGGGLSSSASLEVAVYTFLEALTGNITGTNKGKEVPFADSDLCVIITNSNVKHELAKSKYPERRKECETAATILKKHSLRDAAIRDVENAAGKLDAVQYRRARHVVTEIARTQEAAAALEQNDMKKFGELMYASHESLRDDFEVSCQELDDLVDGARTVDGVLGSRMTGGGFGGCTVTLAPKAIAKDVIKAMKKQMKGKPTFYIVEASAGAQTLELPRK